MILLALIQILMPAFSLILNAALIPVSPWLYLQAFWEVRTSTEILLFFVPFPLAGLAILAMKSWSYPVFLAVLLWSMGSNFWLWWRGEALTNSIFVLLFITLVNLIFVTYYLLPAVRRVYFDRRIRWWENQPRFSVSFPGQVETAKYSLPCKIRDLSEGGVFFESTADLRQGESLTLTFDIAGQKFSFPGQILHCRTSADETKGFGVKLNLSREERHQIRDLIFALRLLGFQIKNAGDDFLTSFRFWLKDLLHGRRRAFLPEVTQKS